jgi:sulfur-oxidizing protein SoxY
VTSCIFLPRTRLAAPSRREALTFGLGLGAAVLVRPAAATQQELTQAMTTFAAGARIQVGRVLLDVARLVDNGNAVPATVTVDSPMSPADHVTAIAIFNERNPQTEVASFQLGPLAGVAKVSTRIRLATTQQLVAMARMNDGSCWSHTIEVFVTLAACIETD